MMDFEDQLRASLRRKDPPPGFAARLLARLPARQVPVWRRLAVGIAAALVIATGVIRYHEYQKGLEAKHDLLLALEITAEKMSVAESAAQSRIRQWSQRSE
jgi:hypothetical protein